MEKISAYVKSAISEMKKVTWPTKEQTITYSIVVIALSLGLAATLGLFDYLLNLVLGTII